MGFLVENFEPHLFLLLWPQSIQLAQKNQLWWQTLPTELHMCSLLHTATNCMRRFYRDDKHESYNRAMPPAKCTCFRIHDFTKNSRKISSRNYIALEWPMYKTAKPLLYTLYRTRNLKQLVIWRKGKFWSELRPFCTLCSCLNSIALVSANVEAGTNFGGKI